jgi:hypothetical protein
VVLFAQWCLNNFKLVKRYLKGRCKENIWARKGSRMLENKSVEIKSVPQGADIVKFEVNVPVHHITIRVKFIQNPPTKMVWSCWKNEKPKNAKTADTMERTRERRPQKRWKHEVETQV